MQDVVSISFQVSYRAVNRDLQMQLLLSSKHTCLIYHIMEDITVIFGASPLQLEYTLKPLKFLKSEATDVLPIDIYEH